MGSVLGRQTITTITEKGLCTSPCQQSWHRKIFQRKADNNKKIKKSYFFSEGALNSVPAHLCLEFRVFLINASTKKYTQEKRIISYWFKDLFPANERAGEAQEFFKKLVSPVNFPRGKLGCFNLQKEILIQWGSEIRTSLDFEWLKRGGVANGMDFKWDLKSGSPIIWNPDNWLSKTIWNSNKNVWFWMFWFLNGWSYSHS